jgi:catechol 2,3-dioxygenase-like lactoylglutathione lyase family enzyme
MSCSGGTTIVWMADPVHRRVCVDHMTLPVGDLSASIAFYRAALVDGMGWTEQEVDRLTTFGPSGAEDLSLRSGGPLSPAIHLAFAAASVEEIEAFHAHGLRAGGTDNGAPGPRPQYSPGYHGAFLLDPDGHNVEAVFHAPSR